MIKKLLLYILLTCSSSLVYFNAIGQQQDNKTTYSNESLNLVTYPNPVSNRLTVKFSNNLKQQVHKLEIVNIIGKRLREQQILDKNTSEINFNDLEDLPQGIYLIIAKDEYGKIIQSNKFLINK